MRNYQDSSLSDPRVCKSLAVGVFGLLSCDWLTQKILASDCLRGPPLKKPLNDSENFAHPRSDQRLFLMRHMIRTHRILFNFIDLFSFQVFRVQSPVLFTLEAAKRDSQRSSRIETQLEIFLLSCVLIRSTNILFYVFKKIKKLGRFVGIKFCVIMACIRAV